MSTYSETSDGDGIVRLLAEIDALIRDDDTADRTITGAWKTFDDINAAANAHAWDAYSIDLSVDAASYRHLDRRQRNALLRIFGTIYRAESIVDDWMDRIVAAIPTDPGYDALGAQPSRARSTTRRCTAAASSAPPPKFSRSRLRT